MRLFLFALWISFMPAVVLAQAPTTNVPPEESYVQKFSDLKINCRLIAFDAWTKQKITSQTKEYALFLEVTNNSPQVVEAEILLNSILFSKLRADIPGLIHTIQNEYTLKDTVKASSWKGANSITLSAFGNEIQTVNLKNYTLDDSWGKKQKLDSRLPIVVQARGSITLLNGFREAVDGPYEFSFEDIVYAGGNEEMIPMVLQKLQK